MSQCLRRLAECTWDYETCLPSAPLPGKVVTLAFIAPQRPALLLVVRSSSLTSQTGARGASTETPEEKGSQNHPHC